MVKRRVTSFIWTSRPRLLGVIGVLAPLLTQPASVGAQDIIELARRRHERPDTTLHDYRSRLNTLVSVGLITDPLAPPKLVLASELASQLAWKREGGMQIRMLGQRYVTSFGPSVRAGLDFDEPWFVATTPGDSLRVLGNIELPTRAAIHPFAEGARLYYHYTLGDTVTLVATGRQVDLVEIRVSPTRGDEALVVGSLWVDAATGDLAAMQIRFVGQPLWAEDEDDLEGAKWANRILSVSATIEQGLWDQRYWLPRRQELELMVRIPFIGNLAIPIVFATDFGRYDINSLTPIAWVSSEEDRAPGAGDAAAEGGGGGGGGAEVEVRTDDDESGDTIADPAIVRTGSAFGGWEIIRAPDDSLEAYDEWDRPLEAPASRLVLPSAEELERRARELDPEIIGRKTFVWQYDRIAELIRYNRVEALGFGLSARWDLPRRPFWSVGGGVGFGVADLEPKARLGIRYDAPRIRTDLTAYSELHTAGSVLTQDNRAYGSAALRALFLGRDDADWYRASGTALTTGRRWGRLRGRAGLAFEDHASVSRNTQTALPDIWNDSVFQTNPPVDKGFYYRGALETTVFVGDWTRPTNRAEWVLGLEAGTGPDSRDYLQPRTTLEGRVDLGRNTAVAFTTQAAWTGGTAPVQREFRIGGLETVRGFTHGVRQGDSFWTVSVEASRRRKIISPVAFADFGWAGSTNDWPGGDVVWSAGAGASLLHGIFRADLVFPEFEEVWLELYFAGSL